MLKRTTKKYFDEVFSYISEVKKFHSEETSPMKKLHSNSEETSHQDMKKLHSSSEIGLQAQ